MNVHRIGAIVLLLLASGCVIDDGGGGRRQQQGPTATVPDTGSPIRRDTRVEDAERRRPAPPATRELRSRIKKG